MKTFALCALLFVAGAQAFGVEDGSESHEGDEGGSRRGCHGGPRDHAKEWMRGMEQCKSKFDKKIDTCLNNRDKQSTVAIYIAYNADVTSGIHERFANCKPPAGRVNETSADMRQKFAELMKQPNSNMKTMFSLKMAEHAAEFVDQLIAGIPDSQVTVGFGHEDAKSWRYVKGADKYEPDFSDLDELENKTMNDMREFMKSHGCDKKAPGMANKRGNNFLRLFNRTYSGEENGKQNGTWAGKSQYNKTKAEIDGKEKQGKMGQRLFRAEEGASENGEWKGNKGGMGGRRGHWGPRPLKSHIANLVKFGLGKLASQQANNNGDQLPSPFTKNNPKATFTIIIAGGGKYNVQATSEKAEIVIDVDGRISATSDAGANVLIASPHEIRALLPTIRARLCQGLRVKTAPAAAKVAGSGKQEPIKPAAKPATTTKKPKN